MLDCDERSLQKLILDSLVHLDDLAQMEFGSHRTSADQIEHSVRAMLLGADARFKPPASARSSGDVLYQGDVLCHINIKSTDTTKQFHMPNLISANSLSKILARGETYYLVRILHHGGKISAKEAWDIRDISWENLQIGALGAGQIQIRNGLTPLTMHQGSEKDWMDQWYRMMVSYYQKEITKAQKRMLQWQPR